MTQQQPSDIYRPDRPAGSIGRLWLAVFVATALLYTLTCQRGFAWQDSGIRAWQIVRSDLRGTMGLALAHPGYVLAAQLCRLAPKAHVATVINAFSAVGMAVALANLAAVVALLARRRRIGLMIAAIVALMHTPWWLATIAETYTWSLAGLTGELWLLVVLIRRPSWPALSALALINGLGLCVHNFALLPLPVYLAVAVWLIAKKRLGAGALALAAAAWLLGAGLYLTMTVQEIIALGSVAAGIESALFGRFAGEVLNVAGRPPRLLENAGLAAMNGVNVIVPLALVGWWRLRRWAGPPTAAALAAVTLIHVAFVARYSVQDQFTFLLPALTMIALAAGVGAASLAAVSRRWKTAVTAACLLSVLAEPVFYAAAPRLAERFAPARRWAQRNRHRDELRYFLVPWKHNENSAETYAAKALAQAAPDGVILADGTSKYALLLTHWRDGAAPQVAVQHDGAPLPRYHPAEADAFWSALGGRSLFAVAADETFLHPDFRQAVRINEPAEHEVLYRLDQRP